MRFLAYTTLSILLAYLVYPGDACEYFLLGFFALLPIISGLFLAKFQNWLLVVLMGAFIIVSTSSVLQIDQSKYGLLARTTLLQKTQQIIRDKPFVVEVATTTSTAYPQYAGWCLMYRSLGTTPISCPADKSFGWILNEKNDTKPVYKIILAEGNIYQPNSTLIKDYQEGVYHAYLYLLP